ncbi:jg2821, partial [Pararge aegeria aegeria]
MKSSYTVPTIASRLVTDKNQFKHPASLPLVPPAEDTFIEEIEPLDTTHEGFEKYLDPYLSTNRLHHRPYTADQLARPSNSKDVITFYTYANVPW